MSHLKHSLTRSTLLAGAALLLLLALGCSEKPARPVPDLSPTRVPTAADYRRTAESQYFPYMTPALKSTVEAQAWYQELTPAGLDLVAAMQKCERAAVRRGQPLAVAEMLKFSSEQGWYADGLDERETKALSGVFAAYLESLNDENAPPVGPVIASTLRNGHFEVVPLAETGEMVLLVSSEDRNAGAKALSMSVEALPKIELIVGAFPYKFLHIQVVELLPYHAGVSYNEFIGLSPNWVDQGTVAHEITHSTLYGIFPLWFEEGLAHFIEYYLVGTLDPSVREHTADLRLLGRDARLDLRPRRTYTERDVLAERFQGFLFLKSVYDIEGIDSLSRTIRALRTRTFTDQELLGRLVQEAPTDLQGRVSQLICERVLGTIRNYCVPQ